MPDATYRTSREQLLDEIIYNHYGRTEGIVERVLEANRGLANYGVLIPANVQIILPKIGTVNSQIPVTPTIRLWD